MIESEIQDGDAALPAAADEIWNGVVFDPIFLGELRLRNRIVVPSSGRRVASANGLSQLAGPKLRTP